MERLYDSALQATKRLADNLPEEDRYCDGCYFLEIKQPFKGITTADVNPWRDDYKGVCTLLNKSQTNTTKNKVPRFLECIVTNSKQKIKKEVP